MPNMKTIIAGHNKKLLEKKSSQQSKPCNCKNKDICPLKRILPTTICHLSSRHIA